jgi:hypothetical protein
MTRPDVGYLTSALLHLGIELADRDPQLRTRLENLGTGADQRQVLIVRNLDQPVEHWIMEHLPPVAVLLISGFDRRIIGFEPFGSDRR